MLTTNDFLNATSANIYAMNRLSSSLNGTSDLTSYVLSLRDEAIDGNLTVLNKDDCSNDLNVLYMTSYAGIIVVVDTSLSQDQLAHYTKPFVRAGS